MPFTSKEIIEAYFKANLAIKKFYNTLSAFLKMALQALNLIDKDKNENEKKVNKAFKLKLALNSIKYG